MTSDDRELIRRAAEFVGWEKTSGYFYFDIVKAEYVVGSDRGQLHALVGLVEDNIRGIHNPLRIEAFTSECRAYIRYGNVRASHHDPALARLGALMGLVDDE